MNGQKADGLLVKLVINCLKVPDPGSHNCCYKYRAHKKAQVWYRQCAVVSKSQCQTIGLTLQSSWSALCRTTILNGHYSIKTHC